jgi:hypothetical protein
LSPEIQIAGMVELVILDAFYRQQRKAGGTPNETPQETSVGTPGVDIANRAAPKLVIFHPPAWQGCIN